MTYALASHDGILIAVRLTPRADRDALEAAVRLADGRDYLQVRVRALPTDGAANAALIALVAKALRVPKSSVSIVAGTAQRTKRVHVTGSPAELAERLAAVLAN